MEKTNTRKILINDLRINYKVAGLGPAVLILHGWGGSSGSWEEIQEILAEKGYKVICPDLPGFGKSQPPKKPWNVGDYVKWMYDFVGFLGLERFFLLGHSFGGRVAIKMAVSYPEKLDKLILCASGGIKHEPDFKTKIIFLMAKVGNTIFGQRVLTRFKDMARNLFYVFLRNRDYVKAKGIMRETIKKVLDEDLLSCSSKVKTKTLIIWGKKDKILPVEDAYLFNKNIEGSELEILSEAKHSPHLENPEKLSNIIISFIKG